MCLQNQETFVDYHFSFLSNVYTCVSFVIQINYFIYDSLLQMVYDTIKVKKINFLHFRDEGTIKQILLIMHPFSLYQYKFCLTEGRADRLIVKKS